MDFVVDLVIYHANCWDGFCAAWLGKRAWPKVELVPAQYGYSPPDVTGKRVLIADFSYPREVMRSVIRAAKDVIVLDHHKTAEAALAGLADEFAEEEPDIRFDMAKSGGRLTWEYLCEVKGGRVFSGPSPWLVDYTEDRDLWKWQLSDSKAINAALRSYPLDLGTWDDLGSYTYPPHFLKSEGNAILRREQQIIDDHVRNAREIEMDGHKILAVNATVLFSDIAGELANDRPFGACYFDRSDGKRQWSLRSRDGGVDVSEIAKAHGGGGHRNAAGFEEVAK